MRTMYRRSQRYHVLMDHAAEEGVSSYSPLSDNKAIKEIQSKSNDRIECEAGGHTHLPRLPKPRLLRQELHALLLAPICILVLQPFQTPTTIPRSRIANAIRQLQRRVLRDLRYSHVLRGSGGTEKVLDGPLPPFECGVVLG